MLKVHFIFYKQLDRQRLATSYVCSWAASRGMANMPRVQVFTLQIKALLGAAFLYHMCDLRKRHLSTCLCFHPELIRTIAFCLSYCMKGHSSHFH